MLLCVSRIDYQKNQLALVEMMRSLMTRHHDAHLVLIGPVTIASYHLKIIECIERLGLSNQVTLLPGLPTGSTELVDAYHAADVFCLPSKHEPFGIVVLEAWAAGLPVVASGIGGIPTFTEDGEDVLHTDPEDPATIVAAVDALLSNDQLHAKLAANGLKKARSRFDWSRITERLASIYQEVRSH